MDAGRCRAAHQLHHAALRYLTCRRRSARPPTIDGWRDASHQGAWRRRSAPDEVWNGLSDTGRHLRARLTMSAISWRRIGWRWRGCGRAGIAGHSAASHGYSVLVIDAVRRASCDLGEHRTAPDRGRGLGHRGLAPARRELAWCPAMTIWNGSSPTPGRPCTRKNRRRAESSQTFGCATITKRTGRHAKRATGSDRRSACESRTGRTRIARSGRTPAEATIHGHSPIIPRAARLSPQTTSWRARRSRRAPRPLSPAAHPLRLQDGDGGRRTADH